MDVDGAARPPGPTGSDPAAGVDRGPGAPEFTERLRTPWWWYLVGLFVASLIAAEFRIAGYHLTVWIPFCTLLPLSVLIVYFMGHQQIAVTGRTLRAGDRELDLSTVTGVVALDQTTTRRVIGREGDPAAVLFTRAWIGPSVQLWLDPPDDRSDAAGADGKPDADGNPDVPVPYWLVSTRRPEELVGVLRARLR